MQKFTAKTPETAFLYIICVNIHNFMHIFLSYSWLYHYKIKIVQQRLAKTFLHPYLLLSKNPE
jgi:hypothetical protein